MQTNQSLVDYLVRSGVIRSSLVREAFLAVDRALFVPERLSAHAYLDRPLPIGEEQTISQPSVVALMLEELSVQQGMRVLDVGCGSGWTTALLAHLVGSSGEVLGVERVECLVSFARRNVSRVGVRAQIHLAGDHLGLPGRAPFDRVLVSAAATRVPESLVDQLVSGGLMVLPVRSALLTVKRSEEGFLVVREQDGFRFVPLIE